MIKNIIQFIFLLFIFSCDEFVAEIGDPQVIIHNVDSLDGSTIDTSSVTISWEGNEFALDYSYRLELSEQDIHNYDPVDTYASWSGWSNETTITLDYLDEAKYNFYVTGRYNIENVQTAEITFTVDAIQDTALRIYPLRQKVALGNHFFVYVFAENIENLLGSEIDLQYNESILEYKSSSSDCDILINTETIGMITEICGNSGGINSTNDPLFQLEFKRIGDGDTEIEIISTSSVGDPTGIYYGVNILKSGKIEVAQ